MIINLSMVAKKPLMSDTVVKKVMSSMRHMQSCSDELREGQMKKTICTSMLKDMQRSAAAMLYTK